MERERFGITVQAADQAEAGRGAQALADALREAEGVLEVGRRKADPDTMDLGTILEVVATAGTILSLAHDLLAWLRRRPGVTLTISRDEKAGSLKAVVEGIDAKTATRIVELIRRG